MAEVRVFAQDAVAGHLPGICVKDGTRTDDRLAVRASIDVGAANLGWAWLPILLGPPGWLALVGFVLWRRSPLGVVVELPFSAASRRRLVRTRRHERVAVVAVVVLLAAAIAVLVVDMHSVLLLSALLVGVVVAATVTVVSAVQLASLEVRGRLDRSRRWIVLANVEPEFAFAAWDQARSHLDGAEADLFQGPAEPGLASAAG
jgi:hypothetical protein